MDSFINLIVILIICLTLLFWATYLVLQTLNKFYGLNVCFYCGENIKQREKAAAETRRIAQEMIDEEKAKHDSKKTTSKRKN